MGPGGQSDRRESGLNENLSQPLVTRPVAAALLDVGLELAGPGAVGAACEAHAVVFEQQVMVGRRDIDPAAPDRLAVLRMSEY